jgi:hypothetical protein
MTVELFSNAWLRFADSGRGVASFVAGGSRPYGAIVDLKFETKTENPHTKKRLASERRSRRVGHPAADFGCDRLCRPSGLA